MKKGFIIFIVSLICYSNYAQSLNHTNSSTCIDSLVKLKGKFIYEDYGFSNFSFSNRKEIISISSDSIVLNTIFISDTKRPIDTLLLLVKDIYALDESHLLIYSKKSDNEHDFHLHMLIKNEDGISFDQAYYPSSIANVNNKLSVLEHFQIIIERLDPINPKSRFDTLKNMKHYYLVNHNIAWHTCKYYYLEEKYDKFIQLAPHINNYNFSRIRAKYIESCFKSEDDYLTYLVTKQKSSFDTSFKYDSLKNNLFNLMIENEFNPLRGVPFYFYSERKSEKYTAFYNDSNHNRTNWLLMEYSAYLLMLIGALWLFGVSIFKKNKYLILDILGMIGTIIIASYLGGKIGATIDTSNFFPFFLLAGVLVGALIGLIIGIVKIRKKRRK